MIQRIQTIYLLAVTILIAFSMFLTSGFFTADAGISQQVFKSLGVTLLDGSLYSTWGLFVLLLISALISFLTIFLFRNRPLQIRLSIFNTIIMIGYYGALAFFVWKLQTSLNADFKMSWSICLPLIAVILNVLAIRAIGKDEVLVRATDRIR